MVDGVLYLEPAQSRRLLSIEQNFATGIGAEEIGLRPITHKRTIRMARAPSRAFAAELFRSGTAIHTAEKLRKIGWPLAFVR